MGFALRARRAWCTRGAVTARRSETTAEKIVCARTACPGSTAGLVLAWIAAESSTGLTVIDEVDPATGSA